MLLRNARCRSAVYSSETSSTTRSTYAKRYFDPISVALCRCFGGQCQFFDEHEEPFEKDRVTDAIGV
jgi:hypothetical protein